MCIDEHTNMDMYTYMNANIFACMYICLCDKTDKC